MSPSNILILFFIFFVGEYIFSAVLTLLNIKSSQKNKNTVPEFISPFISSEKYRKTVQYSLAKEKFSLIVSGITAAVTAIVIISRIPALIFNYFSLLELHPYVLGIGYLLTLTALSSLLSLPFSIYSQFVIEKEFGFNKMTVRTFVIDLLKSSIISTVLFIPLLTALFFFMDKAGDIWWLYAFLFFASFQIIVSILYPLVIAPLFNKFKPLETGSLKERLNKLAEQTSFKAKGIYVMDGSRRSSHSNAYFTGFGKSRRIVLFDTLISSLSEEEIEGVLAHEIGHFKKKHIIKNMVSSLIISLIIFYLLSIMAGFIPLFEAFGFNSSSLPALLVILSFCIGPFSFFFKPLFSIFSRKNEYEADRYAKKTLGSHESLKNALINLGKENLSNLTPHKLYSFFYYSHPVLSERIKAMEKS